MSSPSCTPSRTGLELLEALRQHLGAARVAERLQVNPRTVSRWLSGQVKVDGLRERALRDLYAEAFPASASRSHAFRFIDLFAGIGGMRLGFEAAGGRCVFTSEWDRWCQRTYMQNFPGGHAIAGDIREVSLDSVPEHEILVGGFPCQPFSIAGVSKKNALGRPHGFQCETQGTLFFYIQKILERHRPPAFLLENVKNLRSHDKGNTFRVIMDTLTVLGYRVHAQVVDARHFVPQHRERILLAGFRDDVPFTWDALKLPAEHPLLGSILHPENGTEPFEEPYTQGPRGKVNPKYTLTDHLWDYLQNYAAKHRAAGNGFGFGLVGRGDVARTLSARYYKDGSEILVRQARRKNPRRLTPRECARLMGFPDTFRIPVSDTQAYKQFGNSVAVPVIEQVARLMVASLEQARETGGRQVALAV